jgi:hypothetical protein
MRTKLNRWRKENLELLLKLEEIKLKAHEREMKRLKQKGDKK